ncbi:amidase family protein [Hortaea werneckii]|nr:amidase family protein [Hortaea werneckii]
MALLQPLVALLALHSSVVLAEFHPQSVDNSAQLLSDPYPYEFPQASSKSIGNFPMPPCNGTVIEDATIDQLQRNLEEGTLTAQQLVKCYLQRIDQTNDYINSVLEINPDCPRIAASLDDERRAGRTRGPLHGIPFMVKDNIATKDRMETTAGSWALVGSVVPRDAYVVERLREAGAVLLGKATLSEWADMRSNNYSEGYSGRGGQCRSAYNLTVNPGGSSSGSAVGVAANVFTFAIGTETDGSVINPAERNAVVGIKPTVGLTSRAGVVPESLNQDTVGCFALTVRDATYVLHAIYGQDSRDDMTAAQVGRTPEGGYTPYLTDHHALKQAVFGVPWETFWVFNDDKQRAVLLSMIETLKDAGATIVNKTELPSRDLLVSPKGWDWDYGTSRGYPNESEYAYVKVDFYNNIKSYLSELDNTDMKSLEDIVAYNHRNDGSEGGKPWPFGIPAFYSGQDGFLASLETNGTMDQTYWEALEFCRYQSRERGIDAALSMGPNDTQLDALLVPPDVGQTYQVAAQAGYPMITVPAGVHSDSHMPFGLALMQTAWREDALVKWASAIEDLQLATGTLYRRTLPQWHGYLERNIPVLNA